METPNNIISLLKSKPEFNLGQVPDYDFKTNSKHRSKIFTSEKLFKKKWEINLKNEADLESAKFSIGRKIYELVISKSLFSIIKKYKAKYSELFDSISIPEMHGLSIQRENDTKFILSLYMEFINAKSIYDYDFSNEKEMLFEKLVSVFSSLSVFNSLKKTEYFLHNDYFPKHILFSQEKTTHIVDFELVFPVFLFKVEDINNFNNLLEIENKRLFENYMNLLRLFAKTEKEKSDIKKLLEKYKKKFHDAYELSHSFEPIHEGYWHGIFNSICTKIGIEFLENSYTMSNSASFSLTTEALSSLIKNSNYSEIF